MVGDTQQSDDFDRALSDAPSNHSHTSANKGEIIVWYDLDRDNPDVLVQYVERYTELSYEGERECHHDDVAGLRFSE